MSTFREYVLRIVAVALICAVLSLLGGESKQKELLRVLNGLMMSFIVILPLSNMNWEQLPIFGGGFSETGEVFAQEGKLAARNAVGDIIKAETEAYILDKAAALNASLTLDILLSEENIPERVILSGSISPYARQQLEVILETELGIAKENQQWSG